MVRFVLGVCFIGGGIFMNVLIGSVNWRFFFVCTNEWNLIFAAVLWILGSFIENVRISIYGLRDGRAAINGRIWIGRYTSIYPRGEGVRVRGTGLRPVRVGRPIRVQSAASPRHAVRSQWRHRFSFLFNNQSVSHRVTRDRSFGTGAATTTPRQKGLLPWA